MYVYLMNNVKSVDKELIKSHVEYLKELKRQGKLVLCGPFTLSRGNGCVCGRGFR